MNIFKKIKKKKLFHLTEFSRRMRSDSVQSDLLLSANPSILSSKTESRSSLLTDKHHHHHHHHRHHCHRCSDEIIRCPHHVALPDGEWNQSYSNLQLRNSYQVNKQMYYNDFKKFEEFFFFVSKSDIFTVRNSNSILVSNGSSQSISIY